jgi:DivIVA domain-containing protein
VTPRLPNGTRLTPGRVRSMTFRLARLGHRGLDEDDVRAFCDQVEAELTQLQQERHVLQREVHRLRSWARARGQIGGHARNRAGAAPALPLGAPTMAEAVDDWASVAARTAGPAETQAAGIAGVPALSGSPFTPPHGNALVAPRCRHQDAHGQAVRILATAQQTAEQYVSDAHAYSRTVAHDAQRRRERILAEAHAQATVLLEQAHHAAVRAGLTSERASTHPGAGPRPDHRFTGTPAADPGPAGQDLRPPAAPRAPALPAPVPEPRAPAPARTPDPSPSAEPAIYNAVAARYPHMAPPRRERPRERPRELPRGVAPLAAPTPEPPRDPGERRDPRAGRGRTGTGAHRATQPRRADPAGPPDPGPWDPSPAPRHNVPAPPPDYSTVIDYPGPAAHYQGLDPVHHESGRDRDRSGRDRSRRTSAWFSRGSGDEADREAQRYLDQYRDPDTGEPRFPF